MKKTEYRIRIKNKLKTNPFGFYEEINLPVFLTEKQRKEIIITDKNNNAELHIEILSK